MLIGYKLKAFHDIPAFALVTCMSPCGIFKTDIHICKYSYLVTDILNKSCIILRSQMF